MFFVKTSRLDLGNKLLISPNFQQINMTRRPPCWPTVQSEEKQKIFRHLLNCKLWKKSSERDNKNSDHLTTWKYPILDLDLFCQTFEITSENSRFEMTRFPHLITERDWDFRLLKGETFILKLTNFIDMMDLSLLDSLSSIAMTTQFAMMVMMMTQSKGGQLTSQVIIFLTGLVGVKRKREVGPLSSGSSFFFFLILRPQQTSADLSRPAPEWPRQTHCSLGWPQYDWQERQERVSCLEWDATTAEHQERGERSEEFNCSHKSLNCWHSLTSVLSQPGSSRLMVTSYSSSWSHWLTSILSDFHHQIFSLHTWLLKDKL